MEAAVGFQVLQRQQNKQEEITKPYTKSQLDLSCRNPQAKRIMALKHLLVVTHCNSISENLFGECIFENKENSKIIIIVIKREEKKV